MKKKVVQKKRTVKAVAVPTSKSVESHEQKLSDIANLMRRDVLKMTAAAGSGHATSCLSCAELMSVLFFHEMKYETKDEKNPDNDEFILSKGHAAPILYSALSRAGCIKNDLFSLRKLNSELEGHPTPRLKWIKVATGSLGQGASIGVGMALAAKLQDRNYRTYVLMGDSETAEGSVWEAFQLASYYKLNNLCFIIDVNRLGQRGETMLGHKVEEYEKRGKAFGLAVVTIDGHNISNILQAFAEAKKISDRPTLIVAKTLKGKGVSFLEDKDGWHGRALKFEELERALNEIADVKMPEIKIEAPKVVHHKLKFSKPNENKYKIGEEVATREAYGSALAKLAEADERVLVLDGEVSNSTFAEKVKVKTEKQFIECFIAEQNMIGMALGLSKKGYEVFASSFAAFLSRAHDQLRMSSLSLGNFTVCGSHAGVSIGDDGASQMGLDDLAMFRDLPTGIVLYPSDAISTEKLVRAATKEKGIKYIRTTRAKTKIIYDAKEKFEIGDFKILKQSKKDSVVLVGAGITLHEALKAYEILKREGISASVVDLYCIKPFDGKKFFDFVKKHGVKIVVAEDHFAEGGIGEMLTAELENSDVRIIKLSVKETPHSGKQQELLAKYGLDANAIVRAAKKLI